MMVYPQDPTIRMSGARPTALVVTLILGSALGVVGSARADNGRDLSPQSSSNTGKTLETTQAVEVSIPAVSERQGEGSELNAVEQQDASPVGTVIRRGAKRRESSPDRFKTSGAGTTPWYRSTLSSLAVVMALLGVAYFLVRRWIPAARSNENRALRIVARTTLSPKHTVALVEVGRRYVMIGMSPDRISTLSEFTEPNEVADLTLRMRAGNNTGRGEFDKLLGKEAAEFVERPDEYGIPLQSKPRREPVKEDPVADLVTRLQTLRSKR